MKKRWMYSYAGALALSLMGALTGCTAQQLAAYGEQRCLNLPSATAQSRADCFSENRRVFDEYDKIQKREPLPVKGAVPQADDPLCYVNPSAGQKACATAEIKGK